MVNLIQDILAIETEGSRPFSIPQSRFALC
jgi:hypothetical protein